MATKVSIPSFGGGAFKSVSENSKKEDPFKKRLRSIGHLYTERLGGNFFPRHLNVRPRDHLGMGSFGNVFKSFNGGKWFAIKIPTEDIWNDTEDSENSSRREPAIHLAMSPHPNIVTAQTLVSSRKERTTSLVMEYDPSSKDLTLVPKHLFQVRESMPPQELQECISRLKNLAMDVISAIEHVHNHGVVHRDIGKRNILWIPISSMEDGIAKLIDFGLSRDIRTSSGFPLEEGKEPDKDPKRPLTPCGSPYSMPIEALEGEVLDGKAYDIWGIGVLFYEVSTGKRTVSPHIRDGEELIAVKREPFEYPSNFPLSLQDLITKLRHPNPKNRLTIPQIKAHPFFRE